jgi:hypothetical protein
MLRISSSWRGIRRIIRHLDYSSARAPALNTSSTNTPFERLDISGPRDKLTDEYCAWQELQVEEPVPKAAYQRAGKGSNIESDPELRSIQNTVALVRIHSNCEIDYNLSCDIGSRKSQKR